MKPFLVAATLIATASWFVSSGIAQDGFGGNRGTPQAAHEPAAAAVHLRRQPGRRDRDQSGHRRLGEDRRHESLPNCTVAGMAFDNGGTGYISIGCGPGSGGNIYSWNPATNAITLLGNANGSTKSVTDIEAIF